MHTVLQKSKQKFRSILVLSLILGLTQISAPANAAPGDAAAVAVTTQPSGAVNDAVFSVQPVVKIVEDDGITVVTSSSAVVTVAKKTGSGTLSGTLTATASSGVATFTNLKIVGAGVHVLTFTATSLTSGDSAPFTVTVGAASAVAVTTQPSGAVNDAVFTGQPVVRIVDSAGTTVTSSSAVVTVAKKTGSGTLSGTLTATASSGVATFTNLKIVGAGAHVLTFTATSLTPVDSASFSVTEVAAEESGDSTSPVQTIITTNNLPTSSPWLKLTDSNSSLKVNFATKNKGKIVKIYNNQKGKTVVVGFAKLDKSGNATIKLNKKVLPGSLFAMIGKQIKNVISVG
jgi:hypothetical protein